MNQELVAIPPKDAMAVFTADDPAIAFAPFLAHIRRELDAFVPDLSTAKSRKEIASIAYKVAQSKTYLDNIGKELTAEAKRIPNKIDASRRHIRDTLDQWRDEVRKPLTDWETAEEQRVDAHVRKVEHVTQLAQCLEGLGLDQIKDRIAEAEAIEIGPACEEYETEYARAKDRALTALRPALAAREKYEADQAELARLRQEAAEREAKEAEQRRQREIEEAAQKAAAEAEARAAAAAEQERLRLEAEQKAERERIERQAQEEKAAAERRELELKLAAEKAAREAAETERRLIEEAEAAKRQAAETEARLRREAEAKAREEEQAARAREADREHRASVNRAAVAALIAGGVEEEIARLVVTLIAKRAVPAVSISY